jgi:beta-N-acetylhexosaminidase
LRRLRGWNATPIDPPGPDALSASVPAEGAGDFFFQSACRSVSVISRRHIPFRPAAEERILLCGQLEEFIQEGRLRFPHADAFLFPFSPFYSSREQDRSRAAELAKRYDRVIFCLANFNSLEVLQELKKCAHKLIVVSTLTPVYLRDVPWVETAVAVFGAGRDSFRAGFAVLGGDYEPSASVPLYFDAGVEK